MDPLKSHIGRSKVPGDRHCDDSAICSKSLPTCYCFGPERGCFYGLFVFETWTVNWASARPREILWTGADHQPCDRVTEANSHDRRAHITIRRHIRCAMRILLPTETPPLRQDVDGTLRHYSASSSRPAMRKIEQRLYLLSAAFSGEVAKRSDSDRQCRWFAPHPTHPEPACAAPLRREL
jgi:hypothetical protein